MAAAVAAAMTVPPQLAVRWCWRAFVTVAAGAAVAVVLNRHIGTILNSQDSWNFHLSFDTMHDWNVDVCVHKDVVV